MSQTRVTHGGIDAAIVAAWEAALGAYSGALDEHRSLLLAIEADREADLDADLDAGQVTPTFVPPVDLEPLPESLLPWARQLLEQTNGLVQLASELAERSGLAVSALNTNGRTAAHRHRLVAADPAASTWDTLL